MGSPTQDERREAVRLARWILQIEELRAPGTVSYEQIVLICRTLLAAQEAFADRLAPVYAAAMACIEEGGRFGTHETWVALRDAVLAAREKERAGG